jgi:hypothetical protein
LAKLVLPDRIEFPATEKTPGVTRRVLWAFCGIRFVGTSSRLGEQASLSTKGIAAVFIAPIELDRHSSPLALFNSSLLEVRSLYLGVPSAVRQLKTKHAGGGKEQQAFHLGQLLGSSSYPIYVMHVPDFHLDYPPAVLSNWKHGDQCRNSAGILCFNVCDRRCS